MEADDSLDEYESLSKVTALAKASVSVASSSSCGLFYIFKKLVNYISIAVVTPLRARATSSISSKSNLHSTSASATTNKKEKRIAKSSTISTGIWLTNETSSYDTNGSILSLHDKCTRV